MVREHSEGHLVAVIDTNLSLSADVAKTFGVPFFTTLDAFFSASLPADILSVCTPNHLHASFCIEGMDHGMHVICEKPMALKKVDCERMIERSLQLNKLIFVVMQNRYSPPSQWLKSVLDSGKLGKLFHIQINCFWNRDDRYYADSPWKGSLEMDGGTLFTQFSHFIDMMYWLFGDVQNEHARFQNFNHESLTEFEDSGTISFDFLSGATGLFNFSTSVYKQNFESTLCIVAEKGTIKIGGQYMEKVIYCDIEDYEMPALPPSNPPNDYGTYKGSAANHSFVIQNVIETLKGDAIATTNAMEGMKVVEIIERFYQFR